MAREGGVNVPRGDKADLIQLEDKVDGQLEVKTDLEVNGEKEKVTDYHIHITTEVKKNPQNKPRDKN